MMPTKPQDADFFNELGQSETGKYLLGFIERLYNHYGSIGTMDLIDEKTVLARKQALQILDVELISRLKLTNSKAKPNQFE